MIAFVYGAACALWVEPVAAGLRKAVVDAGGAAIDTTVEGLAANADRDKIESVYVLPFDPPEGVAAADIIESMLPRAEVVTPFAVQDLCWDKVATQERLLQRGVPMPDTMITSHTGDVIEFVREHEFAILKNPSGCGGAGHMVLWMDSDSVVGDCGSHQYRLKFGGTGEPVLVGDELHHPGPFYLQRLICKRSREAVTPPRVLRAYVVDRQAQFWTERCRESFDRPSDWIINIARGARYRFLAEVSDEAKKIVQRSVTALAMRFGVIDLVQAPGGSPYLLEADVDGRYMFIDRSFTEVPEYREHLSFDAAIARSLVGPKEVEEEAPRPSRSPRRRF